MPPRLYLNHVADADTLIALEFGMVDDGQPPAHWRPVTKSFQWLIPEDQCVGFKVTGFSQFDPEARRVDEIWRVADFSVPVLGLAQASAGEIVIAARSFFDGKSSLNRRFCAEAAGASGEAALSLWRACLEAGDAGAHRGLGITLYELGRFQQAYRHLRHYAEIAPHGSWNWCWYGKAAQALGHWQEARHAYEIAVELEEGGDEPTEAGVLLASLDSGA